MKIIDIEKLHKQFTNKSQQYLTKLITVVKMYPIIISKAQLQVHLANHSKSNPQLLWQHSKGVRKGGLRFKPPHSSVD